ncbi:PAAR domain-containing protein [Providencia rettgeri]|nr:PAAR domain-containing protein [Providencia rettgeri]
MVMSFKVLEGDRTTCGGRVLEGSALAHRGGINFKRQAVQGNKVTCGVHAGRYEIVGGDFTHLIGGQPAADTRKSYSTCPCHAAFIPSNIIGECTALDNLIPDGVYVWTERVGSGHSYVSLHKNNQITVYTYGRFGRTGTLGIVGDGILIRLIGEDARNYYRHELYKMNARVFAVNDANIQQVEAHFMALWSGGSSPVGLSPNVGEATKKYGHTINIYDLSTSNCTTQTVNAIKAGGSKVFEKELSSVRSGYSLARYIVTGQESFVVPASLEDYMVGKKQDLSSLVVIEVTGLFKEQYPNVTGVTPMEKSKLRTLFEAASGAASIIGYNTDFSGEETMGIIGQLLYGEQINGN